LKPKNSYDDSVENIGERAQKLKLPGVVKVKREHELMFDSDPGLHVEQFIYNGFMWVGVKVSPDSSPGWLPVQKPVIVRL
jgi:hypothetical protein